MSYIELTQYNSPNYTALDSRSIEGITIHWWGDPSTNPSFLGIVNYLCRDNGNSSAHVVATGTGRQVAWLVNANNAAWHSGSVKGNGTTIGIECDPRCRDEDYDVVAELIADIWIAYKKKLPLYPHKHWVATRCPGEYDLKRLQSEAETWYGRKANKIDVVREEDVKANYEFARQASQWIELRPEPMGEEEFNKYHKGKTEHELVVELANSQPAKDRRFKTWDYPRLESAYSEKEKELRATKADLSIAAQDVQSLRTELETAKAGLLNKNTPQGRAGRTFLQSLLVLLPMVNGILTLPDVQTALQTPFTMAGLPIILAGLIAAVTYVQNALEAKKED